MVCAYDSGVTQTSLAVLGSTGSIGTQTLDIVRERPDRYRVQALGAGSSVETLAAQAQEFRPELVVLADDAKAAELEALLPAGTEMVAGPGALGVASGTADVIINGVVGFAGLDVTMTALESGRRLGLANKESLIAAGPVVATVRSTPGAELIPVDSEHCALHQCLRANDVDDRVSSLVLTASGGPFRGRSKDDLAAVTIDDALAHPTWSMGPKITIDSSTLMNKGLEVIEAHELYGIDYDHIDVVVHQQSVVHSMVTYSDGATIAQLSMPDMRLCIGYALAYPDRLDVPYGDIDWSTMNRLDFEPPDLEAFPCLGLAYDAGRAGGCAPAWLSAANEVAVESFLDGLMGWSSIADVVKEALDKYPGTPATSLDVVLGIDAEARRVAADIISNRFPN